MYVYILLDSGLCVAFEVIIPPVNLWNYTKIDYWRNEMTERSVDKKTQVRSTEEALKLIDLLVKQDILTKHETNLLREALMSVPDGAQSRSDEEQPAQQEPIYQMQMMDGKWIDQAKHSYEYNKKHGNTVRVLYTSPPASKPLFKEFIKWAGAQGYDCAQTCNSDTGEWICLNPMTADLWKAWQAAHSGIKGDA